MATFQFSLNILDISKKMSSIAEHASHTIRRPTMAAMLIYFLALKAKIVSHRDKQVNLEKKTSVS